MSGSLPAYHPPGQFYSESQPPPGLQYTTGTYQQPGDWANPPSQTYVAPTYVQQPPPQQTIIISDPNYCDDCHHGKCRRHGEMTGKECCWLALAGACCLPCL